MARLPNAMRSALSGPKPQGAKVFCAFFSKSAAFLKLHRRLRKNLARYVAAFTVFRELHLPRVPKLSPVKDTRRISLIFEWHALAEKRFF